VEDEGGSGEKRSTAGLGGEVGGGGILKKAGRGRRGGGGGGVGGGCVCCGEGGVNVCRGGVRQVWKVCTEKGARFHVLGGRWLKGTGTSNHANVCLYYL